MHIQTLVFAYCFFVLSFSFIGSLIDSASSAVNSVTNSVGNAATNAADTTTSIVDSATKIINQKTQQLINKADSIVGETTNNLKQLKNTTIDEVQNTMKVLQAQALDLKNEIHTFSSNALNEIQQKSQQFGRTVSSNVGLAIDTIKAKAEEFINTITNVSQLMCEQQCTSFFNLPCFILFRCTDKIKRFFLMLVLPIVIVLICVYGFCTGLFTPQCFCKVIKVITCVFLVICLLQARKGKEEQQNQEQNRKQKEMQVKKKDEGICSRNKERANKIMNQEKTCLQQIGAAYYVNLNIGKQDQIKVQADEMILQSERPL